MLASIYLERIGKYEAKIMFKISIHQPGEWYINEHNRHLTIVLAGYWLIVLPTNQESGITMTTTGTWWSSWRACGRGRLQWLSSRKWKDLPLQNVCVLGCLYAKCVVWLYIESSEKGGGGVNMQFGWSSLLSVDAFYSSLLCLYRIDVLSKNQIS